MDAPRAAVLSDEAKLRAAGLRVTRPRLAVYRSLRATGGHRSADEVARELRRRKEPFPRMSVYNALSALHQAGLVLRADAGAGRALYEANAGWHHHFVCRRCGRIFDVPCVKGRKPCLEMPSKVGRADEAQVIFRGVCAGCASASRSRRADSASEGRR